MTIVGSQPQTIILKQKWFGGKENQTFFILRKRCTPRFLIYKIKLFTFNILIVLIGKKCRLILIIFKYMYIERYKYMFQIVL